ncbi:putative dehydrogenase [Citrobacter koseri]|nr:putative dehydrogenase [Citrobacter koseri]
MKSIVIEKPDTLVLAERPIPEPAAGDVRVKVKLAGSAVLIAISIVGIILLQSIRVLSGMNFLV